MSSGAAVVLAAGRGQRLGGVAKALLQHEGMSYLQRIVSSLRTQSCGDILVVVAEPFAAEVTKEADALGVQTVCNPSPEEGMGSSVSIGFAGLLEQSRADSAWLWPVDTPFVEEATLEQLRRGEARGSMSVPTHGGRGGHPVLVGREIWPELSECGSMPDGARSVFRRDPSRVRRIEVEDPEVLHDVDRPEDLPRG